MFYPQSGDRTVFKFPPNRQLRINGLIPRELIVMKDGCATGLTVGRYAGLEAYLCDELDVESVELAIYNYDKQSGPFSAKGDSGSLIFDGEGRMLSILHSGMPKGGSNHVTFATPAEFAIEQLRKRYPYADSTAPPSKRQQRRRPSAHISTLFLLRLVLLSRRSVTHLMVFSAYRWFDHWAIVKVRLFLSPHPFAQMADDVCDCSRFLGSSPFPGCDVFCLPGCVVLLIPDRVSCSFLDFLLSAPWLLVQTRILTSRSYANLRASFVPSTSSRFSTLPIFRLGVSNDGCFDL